MQFLGIKRDIRSKTGRTLNNKLTFGNSCLAPSVRNHSPSQRLNGTLLRKIYPGHQSISLTPFFFSDKDYLVIMYTVPTRIINAFFRSSFVDPSECLFEDKVGKVVAKP